MDPDEEPLLFDLQVERTRDLRAGLSMVLTLGAALPVVMTAFAVRSAHTAAAVESGMALSLVAVAAVVPWLLGVVLAIVSSRPRAWAAALGYALAWLVTIALSS